MDTLIWFFLPSSLLLRPHWPSPARSQRRRQPIHIVHMCEPHGALSQVEKARVESRHTTSYTRTSRNSRAKEAKSSQVRSWWERQCNLTLRTNVKSGVRQTCIQITSLLHIQLALWLWVYANLKWVLPHAVIEWLYTPTQVKCLAQYMHL